MTTPVPDIAFDYAHFTHDRLERILPLAQTRSLDEMEFTLLALECYADGFVATVLMKQDWRMPSPLPPADEVELPLLLKGLPIVTEVVDDRGNHYTAHMRSGSGGGGGDSVLLLHTVYCLAPALDPAARELSFTLTQVERPTYDDGHPTWTDDKVVGGPWPLSFPLRRIPAETSASPLTVIPVAQRISSADVSVTVTTVVCCDWGFIVNSRIDWTSPDGPFAQPVWRASDERGGDYGRGNCGGGGNAVGDDSVNSWRMYCNFKPPLDPAATELRLELTSFSARRPVRNEEEDRFDRWETAREVPNLGEIVVPLTAPAP